MSLQSVFNRKFEKLMYHRLKTFLDKNDIVITRVHTASKLNKLGVIPDKPTLRTMQKDLFEEGRCGAFRK